jgi:uracil-DNA glycosylase family 4
MTVAFDPSCTACPRLAAFLGEVRTHHPDYFCAPVPAFGDPEARLLVVGLAPGMHGANATGRPFTGDHAGILLYRTLFEFGFSTAPESLSAQDGLSLINCRITNAVKCLPPQNKPSGKEIATCRRFLANELAVFPPGGVVLALGAIAHRSVLAAMELRQSAYAFAHAAEHQLPRDITLIDSYHCSRYNTQTRRLTPEMFEAVFSRAKALLAQL